MGAVLGIGAGLVTDELNNQRAQSNAYDAFVRGKQMTDYNRNAQLGLWQDTGYGAQVKQMKEAGLNPALMYKGAGSGGSTSLAVGNAQKADTIPSKAIEGMGMGLQAELQQAQVDNLKADTAKKGAEKEEVEQRTPTYAKGMQKTDAEIQEIATKLGVNIETAKKLIQDVEESKSRVPVNVKEVELKGEQVGLVSAEANKINQMLPHEVARIEQEVKSLITRNIYLDRRERAELNSMIVHTTKEMHEIKQQWTRLTIEQKRNEIEQFKAEINAQYPGIQQVVGGQMKKGAKVVDVVTEQIAKSMGIDLDELWKDQVKK